MENERNAEMRLPSLDDLFSNQQERDEARLKKIYEIPIEEIDSFPDHPFKVKDDEDMMNLTESVKANGVLTPATVRRKEDGRYELLSGHRRLRASQLAGFNTLRCEVVEMGRDEATVFMVESNFQRTTILPSEKAFAYKMRLDAMKRQGQRTDLTSAPVERKSEEARDIIGQQTGESREQIRRYIRLTELIPELLDMVDNDVLKQKPSIALRPAVELSHLTEEEQYQLLDCIEYCDATPSHDQSIRLRALSKAKTLTQNEIDRIMSEEKPNQIPHISFNETRIRSVLPKEIKGKNIEDFVVKAIEFYGKHLQKQKSMER